ncbi:hypothetical protein Tco_1275100 [Tanacetum coccineum]
MRVRTRPSILAKIYSFQLKKSRSTMHTAQCNRGRERYQSFCDGVLETDGIRVKPMPQARTGVSELKNATGSDGGVLVGGGGGVLVGEGGGVTRQGLPPILFKISNHYLHFGREEFCLVTGFRCGELSEYVSDKIGFLDRLFREKDKKQRKHVKVADYVNVVQEDCTLVEQTKKPSCSTPVQVDAVINQVDLLCKQLIDVRLEMEGMVDQLKSKVIDTLTTTLESVRKHAEVVEAEVVNCETNLVECPLVEKDVIVLRVVIDSCDMNLVDCPVVHKENSEPKRRGSQEKFLSRGVSEVARGRCCGSRAGSITYFAKWGEELGSQRRAVERRVGRDRGLIRASWGAGPIGGVCWNRKRLEQCESVLMSAPPGWKVDWQAPLVGVVVDLVDHHCKDVSGVMRCVVCWRKANRVSGGTVLVCPGLMVLIVLCADLIGTPELDESCEDCDQGDVLRTYFQIHTWGGGWAGGDQDTTLEGMVGGCDVIIILYDEGGGGAVLGFWFKGSGMVLGGVKAGALLWEWVIIWDGNMNLDKLIVDVTKFENKFLQMIKALEVNVVKGDGKPVLAKTTTPQVKKKRKRFNNLNPIEFSLTALSEHDCSQQTLQPFKEVWCSTLAALLGLRNSPSEVYYVENMFLHTKTPDYVDAYDLDCYDEAIASAIFMESLSPTASLNDNTISQTYDLDILSEVPYYDTYHEKDVLNYVVQETKYTKHLVSNNDSYE